MAHGLKASGALIVAGAWLLSGCDLLESDEAAVPSPSESPTVDPGVEASAEPTQSAAESGSSDDDSGADGDAGVSGNEEMLASGSARIVLNDMDVYTTSDLNCTVSGDGMAFDAELDGPHRGQTFLDGSFGIEGEPDSVGLMMDSGQADFPFWVVQEEDSTGREVGEFFAISWINDEPHVGGAATFEAVAEHNATLTDPPTYQPGTFEIRC